jgi:hypothetical protein
MKTLLLNREYRDISSRHDGDYWLVSSKLVAKFSLRVDRGLWPDQLLLDSVASNKDNPLERLKDVYKPALSAFNV